MGGKGEQRPEEAPVVGWGNWAVHGNLMVEGGKLVVGDGEFDAGVVDWEAIAGKIGDGIREKCGSEAEMVVVDLEDEGKGDRVDDQDGDSNLGEDE